MYVGAHEAESVNTSKDFKKQFKFKMGLCWKYGKRSEYETETEYKERARSHFVIFFTQFNVVISYSAVLIGIWPYLTKVEPQVEINFLGYLIGASALAQTIFSPVIGWWSNKINSNRFLFIGTLMILLSSHLIYAILNVFNNKKYWLLFSRILAGIASGNFAICRSHISATTLVQERRRVVTFLSSCATVSYALGPALQIILPFEETGVWLIPGILKLDMYTVVGWFGVLISIINILLFMPSIFQEHCISKREKICIDNDPYHSKNYKLLAILLVSLNFILTFNFMFLKVLGTPMIMDEYAMSGKHAIRLNSIVVTVGAALSLASILLINPICKFFNEITLLIFALFLMIVGRFCFYSYDSEELKTYNISLNKTNTEPIGCPLTQKWCETEGKIYFSQFIIGNALENVGYAIAITLTMALFSQILGTKKQGTWMGILTAVGSIARITSPVFMTTLYYNFGPSVVTLVTNVIFGAITIFVIKYSSFLLNNKKNMIQKKEIQEHGNVQEIETMSCNN